MTGTCRAIGQGGVTGTCWDRTGGVTGTCWARTGRCDRDLLG